MLWRLDLPATDRRQEAFSAFEGHLLVETSVTAVTSMRYNCSGCFQTSYMSINYLHVIYEHQLSLLMDQQWMCWYFMIAHGIVLKLSGQLVTPAAAADGSACCHSQWCFQPHVLIAKHPQSAGLNKAPKLCSLCSSLWGQERPARRAANVTGSSVGISPRYAVGTILHLSTVEAWYLHAIDTDDIGPVDRDTSNSHILRKSQARSSIRSGLSKSLGHGTQ